MQRLMRRGLKEANGVRCVACHLKEWEQKLYPFLDANMPEMLEQLLNLKLIELLECK